MQAPRARSRFQLRTQLMAHQRIALQRSLQSPESFGLLMEMGTGKTLTVLAEFQSRVGSDDVMDLLVIAPRACIHTWYESRGPEEPSEIDKHLDPRLRADLVVASNRDRATDRAAYRKLQSTRGRPRALFVNVEALSRARSRAEVMCLEMLRAGRCMMVIDESTKIKSHRAARTKVVLRLGRLARARRIMTGLVAPRSPLDLFAQMQFLDPRILGTSFTAFRARYARLSFISRAPEAVIDARLRAVLARRGQRGDIRGWRRDQKIAKIYELGGWLPDTHPIVDGYQRLEELQRRVAPHCHQALKSECLDLPPKIYEARDVEMTDEQTRVYRDVLETATARLNSGQHVTVRSAIEQILRLHQVCCGHVRDEEGRVRDVDSERVSAVLDALEEHQGKAVIWVAYTPELTKIETALRAQHGDAAVARYWGGNVAQREDEERRFLLDADCRFMVATPASGGMGLNWVVADLVIYAANDWNLEHRLQSEDRTHRTGQRRSVTYVDLMTRGTVEERIVHSLRAKIDLAAAVTGAGWRAWLV